MTTYVKTLKNNTRYPVTAIESGKLVARQPSGKRRYLTVKDVGRPRYDAAVHHFYTEQHEAARVAARVAAEAAKAAKRAEQAA